MKPGNSHVVIFNHPNKLPGDFGEAWMLDRCVLIIAYKCLISSVTLFSLSKCKPCPNLLENERQLSNRLF